MWDGVGGVRGEHFLSFILGHAQLRCQQDGTWLDVFSPALQLIILQLQN